MDRHVAPGQERHAQEAAACAHKTREKADDAAGRQLAAGAGHLPRGLGLFVQEHLGGRKGHEHGEKQGEPGALEDGEHAQAGNQAAHHHARREPLDDIPAHGATFVVCAHARQRGEDDRGHRGGDGHLDRQVWGDPTRREHQGDERHHDHAATDPQEARQKAGANAQKGQLREEEGFEEHPLELVLVLFWKKVSAMPPDRHPEPGFRWARSTPRWVHLTRDDHARGVCSKPVLKEHWYKEI